MATETTNKSVFVFITLELPTPSDRYNFIFEGDILNCIRPAPLFLLQKPCKHMQTYSCCKLYDSRLIYIFIL